MAWNPEIYNKFKEQRFQPFYDCLAFVIQKPAMRVIDLGCGTGELTSKLASNLPEPAVVVGIDSSEEMLAGSERFQHPALQFRLDSIETAINTTDKWDLVFSNAALQWVENHLTLLPGLISTLVPGGQLVVQIPAQQHNITNLMLTGLANSTDFRNALEQWIRPSPVLETHEYARILFQHGGENITVMEKIYPIIVKDFQALYEWVSGTALLPYLERLGTNDQEHFINLFKEKLKAEFPGQPAFYPFKRIIFAATFP